MTERRRHGESDRGWRTGALGMVVVLWVLGLGGFAAGAPCTGEDGVRATVLRARLLSEGGNPWTGRVRVALCRSEEQRIDWKTCRASASGEVRQALAANAEARATFVRFRTWSQPVHHVRVPLIVAKAGVIDLGDLRLRPAPLYVDGRVVDGRGAAVSGALVSVEGELDVETKMRPSQAVTDASGRFETRGVEARRSVVLQVTRGGHGFRRRVKFPAGQRDVTIVLPRGDGFGGRLALPDGVHGNGFRIEAETQGGARRSVAVSQGGSFRFRELPPGDLPRLIVRFAHDEDRRPLTVLEDVGRASDGTGVDARLAAVPLPPLRRIELLVRNASGPVAFPASGAVRHDGATPVRFARGNAAGRVSILVRPDSPVDRWVWASGHRPRRVARLTESGTIELERGPDVTLSIEPPSGANPLPQNLGVTLRAVPRTEEWRRADRAGALRPSRVEDGKVRLRVCRPGRHAVTLWRMSSGRPRRLLVDKEAVIVVDDHASSIPVRYSAEAWGVVLKAMK